MKNPFIILGLLIIMSVVAAISAYADNQGVENAIKSRADLSIFYQALLNTGVNHELNPDVSYTVFAPTNEAFARISRNEYPCFYSVVCRARVAEILRNHIIPGNIYVDDAARERGGLFSLDGRFVTIGKPSRNDYAVDGNNIVYMSWFPSGIIYKIDGVIANPRELASVEYYAPKEVTTITRKIIPDPACGPGGCPDTMTETTTVTHTVME